MNSGERVAAYRELFAAAARAGRPPSVFVQPDVERARFHLGTGAADYVVPYVLDPSVAQSCDLALHELAGLWIGRNRAAFGFDPLTPLPSVVTPPVLRPPAYGPPPGLKNPVLRVVLTRAVRLLPSLDSGVLATWLGSEGRGRELIAAWGRVLEQSLREGKSAAPEDTLELSHWVMLQRLDGVGELAAAYGLPAPMTRALSAALALGGLFVHHVVRAQLLAQHPEKATLAGRGSVWPALLSPRVAFLRTPNSFDLCMPYEVRAAVLGTSQQALAQMLDRGDSVDAVLAAADNQLEDKKVRSAAMEQLLHSELRSAGVDALAASVGECTEQGQRFLQWLREPEVVAELCSDKKARKAAAGELLAAAKTQPAESPQAATLRRAHELLADFDPSKAHKVLGVEAAGLRKRVAVSIVAELGDTWMARTAAAASRRLIIRRGDETDRDPTSEYDAGKLFWFGRVDEPVLCARGEAARVGHYFIDLKDFTGRTTLLKEDVMADFIRRNFYEPILATASYHHRGFDLLDDRGGVYLNNLLGDAVSLSGDVAALVAIARQIRRHLGRYADELRSRSQSQGLAERLAEVEAQFVQRAATLASQQAEAAAKLQQLQATPGAAAAEVHAAQRQLQATASAQEQMERDRQTATASVAGQHLQSGSYIGFGAPPTVLTIDGGAWGEQRVSIAEKINETARGCARHGAVMAGLSELLQLQRQRTQNPALELPFRVYLGNPIGLPIPPANELRLREALLRSDAAAAAQVYADTARDHVQQLLQGGAQAVAHYLEKGSALHNAGDAMSGEALAAYRERRAGSVGFVDVEVPPAALGDDLLARYAFTEPLLRLVLGVTGDGAVAEIYHYAGSMVFKGFEAAGATEIWEIVDMETGTASALARSTAIRQVAGLPPAPIA